MPNRNHRLQPLQLWAADEPASAPTPRRRQREASQPPVPAPEPTPGPHVAVADAGGLVLLLSVQEAGKALGVALGVALSTVYELINSGDLEAVHVRRSVRIPVDCVRDYVRGLRRGA